jgi:hypothetical protein
MVDIAKGIQYTKDLQILLIKQVKILAEMNRALIQKTGNNPQDLIENLAHEHELTRELIGCLSLSVFTLFDGNLRRAAKIVHHGTGDLDQIQWMHSLA